MEMKIAILSSSLGIPKTHLGASFGAATFFAFRVNASAPCYLYTISKGPNIGVDSLLFGMVKTKWFTLSQKQHIPNIAELSGYTANLKVEQKGWNKVDVKLELYDKDKEEIATILRIDVDCVKAALLHEFETRNVIKIIPGVCDADF
jgi:hypothetical protein